MGKYAFVGEDITTSKTDAIINSLGIKVNFPGRIYRSILEKTSYGLFQKVLSLSKENQMSYCDTCITDSYGLPCKKIVHVIVPYAWDDPDREKLRAAYRNALQAVFDAGLSSVTVPFIGCSNASGYSSEEVYEIATEECASFYRKHRSMEIYVNANFFEQGLEDTGLDYSEAQYFTEKNVVEDTLFIETSLGSYEPSTAVKSRKRKKSADLVKEKFDERKPINMDHFKSLIGTIIIPGGNTSIGDVIDSLIDASNTDPELSQGQQTKLKLQYWTAFASAPYSPETGTYDETESYEAVDAKRLRERWHYHYPHSSKKSDKILMEKDKVWSKPKRYQLAFACANMHATKDLAIELFEYCGIHLSEYNLDDFALLKCLNQLDHENYSIPSMIRTFHQINPSKSIYQII